MKYMILMYSSQNNYDLLNGKEVNGRKFDPDDFAPMHEFMGRLADDLMASGEFVDTNGLRAPVHTRRIRLQDGLPVVTDGPYAETEEVLAGYWIVDCVSFDRATEIALRLADTPSPDGIFIDSIADVRPVMDFSVDAEF